MSDAKVANQKERVSKVRRKPERESVLRSTFAASHATNTVQTSTFKASSGPGGKPASSVDKIAASKSRIAQNFTQIPTHTTQGIGGLRPGVSIEDSPKVPLGGVGAGMAVDLGTAVSRQEDAAAKTADIKITANNTVPPAWFPHGAFRWHVGFATTGKNGWIVQRVTNTYAGEDSIGGAINNTTVGVTPRYYEAWKVDGGGAVSPSNGSTNDMFERPDLSTDPSFMDPSTKGSFSMSGEVYWTTTDPATSGLAEEGVPDAGILLAGLNKPADLGTSRLSRFAEGSWDSTADPPTHSGSTL